MWQGIFSCAIHGDDATQGVPGVCQACASDEAEDKYIRGVLEGCQVNFVFSSNFRVIIYQRAFLPIAILPGFLFIAGFPVKKTVKKECQAFPI